MSSISALHSVPTSEIHYGAIGVMAVHLMRGSERLPILGTRSIVSRLDQERSGASTVLVWEVGPHFTASHFSQPFVF